MFNLLRFYHMKTRSNALVSRASGLTVDADCTSIAGGATIAAGVLLSTAIGAAVAPAPTLGTIALGGGILAFGQRDKLMGKADADKAEAIPSATEATVPAAA